MGPERGPGPGRGPPGIGGRGGDERFETVVEDGVVHVGSPDGPIPVGEVETVLDLVGGPAWEVEYTDRQKRRYPDMDTSDEGLIVDVVDVMQATTHDRAFVETLAAQPADPAVDPSADAAVDPSDPVDDAGDDPEDGRGSADGEVSPRLGLFVGRLLSDLQYGID